MENLEAQDIKINCKNTLQYTKQVLTSNLNESSLQRKLGRV